MNFHFFALAAHGQGISGGDRIFIELARRWSSQSDVEILLWREGLNMCKTQNLEKTTVKFNVISMKPWEDFGFVINYFARIIVSIKIALSLKLNNDRSTIIYSASEFWMDSLPCLILKKRFPQIKWVAAWYQTAPKPWVGFSQGERKQKYKLNALLYYLSQLPIKPLIENYADLVFVNNEGEKKVFPGLNKDNKAVVVIGAVNLLDRDKYKRQYINLSKKYDAVFQGRFHPQKGVVELIDIWMKVVEKYPGAILAMIGNGPLMESVKLKVKNERLEKNIKLFGYVYDGPQKYKIFVQSKIVVHPAFFDSGGMAAAEAMMFGLPCVGFNLPSYRSYYPKGMIKVKIGDLNSFAHKILDLLKSNNKRDKVGREAVEMIDKYWSWDKRAADLLSQLRLVTS